MKVKKKEWKKKENKRSFSYKRIMTWNTQKGKIPRCLYAKHNPVVKQYRMLVKEMNILLYKACTLYLIVGYIRDWALSILSATKEILLLRKPNW
jgi:hypothetical protein